RRAIAAARATDVTTFAAVMGMHAALVCDEYHAVSDARAARLDKVLAPMTIIRAQKPDFMRALVLGDEPPANPPDDSAAPVDDAVDVVIAAISGTAPPAVAAASTPVVATVRPTEANDLVELVAAHMVSDREWPHIDKPFIELYASLPGMNNGFM
ncbi:MAG TPA: hypothetical protein VGO00_22565, partial [Kofleriaceae bacterium]|nr:hypothetical protein [Kofleriaceae bacterium]